MESTHVEMEDHFDHHHLFPLIFKTVRKERMAFNVHIVLNTQAFKLTLFRLVIFGVLGPGGASKVPPPLHKSKSIDAIVMKLGG